jgi:hypothetical protein
MMHGHTNIKFEMKTLVLVVYYTHAIALINKQVTSDERFYKELFYVKT